MSVLATRKFDEDQMKGEGKSVDMVFPIVSPCELSVGMATTSLMESAPKLKSSHSPVPLMIHTKFGQDWPTNL